MTNKKTLLLLTILAGIIYLAGCSTHNNSSNSSQIVGTWTQNRNHQVRTTDGVTTSDTTVYTSFNLTMTADGHFIGPQYTTTYSVSGNRLTVYSPGSSTTIGFQCNILTLDAHNFVYEILDTPYTFPTVIDDDTHYFTR